MQEGAVEGGSDVRLQTTNPMADRERERQTERLAERYCVPTVRKEKAADRHLRHKRLA